MRTVAILAPPVRMNYTLLCEVDARPDPDEYRWRRDNVVLSGEHGQHLVQVLNGTAYKGVYTCSAHNKAGWGAYGTAYEIIFLCE